MTFFPTNETRCKCGCGCDIEPDFRDWLDRLRKAVERPLTITSGRRCATHDQRIGGKGPHTTGRAADIRAIVGADRHELVSAALLLGARGVGIAQTFVHVDLVQDPKFPRPAIWTYPTRNT